MKYFYFENPSYFYSVIVAHTNSNMNGYAYVANGYDGISIFDINNLPDIQYIGGTANGCYEATNIVLLSDSIDWEGYSYFALVACGITGICAYDLSDPTNPTLLSCVSMPQNSSTISVAANQDIIYEYAFAITSDGNIYAIDITNYSQMNIIGTLYGSSGGCKDIYIINNPKINVEIGGTMVALCKNLEIYFLSAPGIINLKTSINLYSSFTSDVVLPHVIVDLYSTSHEWIWFSGVNIPFSYIVL